MVFPPEVDPQKATLLLKYLAHADKKIKLRTHAVRRLQEQLSDLKKVSGRAAHGKIAKLEENILQTLKEGGFIQEVVVGDKNASLTELRESLQRLTELEEELKNSEYVEHEELERMHARIVALKERTSRALQKKPKKRKK